MAKKIKVALALGGGGARGLAHIGVLKILEREKIPVDLIVGTSIGAIVGGAYAQNPDAELIHRKFVGFLRSPEYKISGLEFFRGHETKDSFFSQVGKWMKDRVVINLARRKSSLVHEKRLLSTVQYIVEEGNFEDTKIPFAAVATDLVKGEPVILTQGDIRRAIEASSTIPGFLPPVEHQNYILTDGAPSALIPTKQALQLGADVVIGVHVGQSLEYHPEPDNVLDIIFRTQLITATRYSKYLRQEADVMICPDVGLIHWAEFKFLELMVERGIESAQEKIDEIHAVLKRKRHPKWKRWLFEKLKVEI